MTRKAQKRAGKLGKCQERSGTLDGHDMNYHLTHLYF